MKNELDRAFSKENCLWLKELCAFVIIIHHCSYYLPKSLASSALGYIGYLPVSLFFFISGYGLMLNYMSNGCEYLNGGGYWKNKIFRIAVPTIIILFIYKSVNYYLGYNYNIADFLAGRANYGHFWYMCVIFLFYFFFYIIGKNTRSEQLVILLNLILVSIYILFAWKINLGSYWYYTTFSFPAGLIFAYICVKKNLLYSILENKYIEVVIGILFCMFTYLKINRVNLGIDYNGIGVGLTLISTAIFPLLISFLLKILNLNIHINFLGVSMEAFLLHNLFISIIARSGDFNMITVVIICICSYFSAFVFKYMYGYIIKSIQK